MTLHELPGECRSGIPLLPLIWRQGRLSGLTSHEANDGHRMRPLSLRTDCGAR